MAADRAPSHAKGPSFVLSDRDLAGLREAISGAAVELPDMEPVGWFHTHTRSEIFLSPDDVAVYNEIFPEPWQVALVMRLRKEQPAVAGFFADPMEQSKPRAATVNSSCGLTPTLQPCAGRLRSKAGVMRNARRLHDRRSPRGPYKKPRCGVPHLSHPTGVGVSSRWPLAR